MPRLSLPLLLLLLLTACIPVPKQPPTLTPTPTATTTPAPPPTETPAPSPTPASLFQPAGEANLPNAQRLIWSTDSQTLGVLGNQTAVLLAVPALQPLFSFSDPAAPSLLDFSADGRTIVSILDQQTLRFTDITNGEQRTLATDFLIGPVHFSPDGLLLVIGSNEEWAAHLYNPQNLTPLKTVRGFQTAAPVYDVRIAENILDLAWSARARIQLQNIPSETLYPSLDHEDFVTAFARSRGDTLLVSAAGGTIDNEYAPILFVWDAILGQELLRLRQDSMPNAVEFSWDDQLLAVGLTDRIDLYTTSDMNVVETLTGHTESVISVRFSPDGRWLASLDSTGKLILWQINPPR
ncbi:MAG: hypothetical protein KatS3mg046_670 [Bellilinea sp.]|nr:MAG: hypothetical protein KatS3mg046_670 [Bellilinea sp.]